jgi:parallel beta-helix repeat protein/predicted outer membrane repeat protein
MRFSTLQTLLFMLFFLLITAYTATGKVIYVDADATGANDGSSWMDSFNYLRHALAIASSGDEIRVAQGVYRPHEPVPEPPPTPVPPPPPAPPDRTATFQLINGVVVRGGYAGFGEPNPDARVIELYESVLSGDLNNDDVEISDPCALLSEPTRAENSYHVVTGSGTDSTAVLDGFTISGGNATGESGGGMYNSQGSPILRNCIFIRNSAHHGAGMYNSSGRPTLTGCVFTLNSAEWRAGGMFNDHSHPTLRDCTFNGNAAPIKYSDSGGMANRYSSPTLTNCTFTGNSSDWGGGLGNFESSSPTLTNCTFSDNSFGGMLNHESSPRLTNCTFNNNSAVRGGGMENFSSNPTLTNCTFIANSAENNGGAIYNNRSSIETLTNCLFSQNSAQSNGGAIVNFDYSESTLVNCTFSENSSPKGGGIFNEFWGAVVTLTNCIFSGNSAIYGGGIYSHHSCIWNLANCTFVGNSAQTGNAVVCDSVNQEFPSSIEMTNCILWDGGNDIWNNDGSTIAITYSDVQGGWQGEGNIDADPCFVEPGYWDANGTPSDANDDFWVDGDYHLLLDSACIDAGDNSAVPPSVTTDLDGNLRIKNGIVDMGAYESPAVFLVDIDATGANDGSSWADAFNRIEDALAVALVGDEIRIAQGTYKPTPPPPFQASGPNPADGATEVSTTVDLSWTAGSGAMSHDVYFGTTSPGVFQGNQTNTTFDPGAMARGTTYYWRIDEVSTWGTTTGEVWRFTTEVGPPPSALSPMSTNDTQDDRIVAHCRLATFVLKNGVIIKGGYAGFGEPDPDARDIDTYQTILSGDMNGDDVEVNDPCDLLTHPSRADNCYHVMTAIEFGYYGPNTILDGFTITGGNANAEAPDPESRRFGGGMYSRDSSPIFINCTFTENSARSGGGIYNEDSWSYLTNCKFSRNFSNWGGGMGNSDSPPTLTNCKFIGNVSSYKGGAMANYDGSPPMNNCTFIDNRALLGGAIYGADCTPEPTNCTFNGNWAEKGGVIYNSDSCIILDNCKLTGNRATAGGVIYDDEGGSSLINCMLTGNTAVSGGVIYSGDESSERLTNCILSGNTAESGGVVYICDDSGVKLIHCTLAANSADNGNAFACDSYQQQYPSSVEVSNSILWDGGSEIWNNDGSVIAITYSDVQGGWSGEGNIDAEPLFVEPGYWDIGDIWIEGDYRLRAGSSCIDGGTDAEVYTDIEGNIRPFDFPGVDNNGEPNDFDMGAYEAVATIQGELLVQPNKVNRNARGKKIFAVMRLPEPIVEDDIDMSEPLVLYPGAIEAMEQNLFQPGGTAQSSVRIRAVFDRVELLGTMPGNEDVDVTIIGRLISGEYFYGSEAITIVSSPR